MWMSPTETRGDPSMRGGANTNLLLTFVVPACVGVPFWGVEWKDRVSQQEIAKMLKLLSADMVKFN